MRPYTLGQLVDTPFFFRAAASRAPLQVDAGQLAHNGSQEVRRTPLLPRGPLPRQVLSFYTPPCPL